MGKFESFEEYLENTVSKVGQANVLVVRAVASNPMGFSFNKSDGTQGRMIIVRLSNGCQISAFQGDGMFNTIDKFVRGGDKLSFIGTIDPQARTTTTASGEQVVQASANMIGISNLLIEQEKPIEIEGLEDRGHIEFRESKRSGTSAPLPPAPPVPSETSEKEEVEDILNS